jgi:hypothetical protein
MNTQIRSTGGLANNFWVQMAALIVVVAVLIALAAKYLWWHAPEATCNSL